MGIGFITILVYIYILAVILGTILGECGIAWYQRHFIPEPIKWSLVGRMPLIESRVSSRDTEAFSAGWNAARALAATDQEALKNSPFAQWGTMNLKSKNPKRTIGIFDLTRSTTGCTSYIIKEGAFQCIDTFADEIVRRSPELVVDELERSLDHLIASQNEGSYPQI